MSTENNIFQEQTPASGTENNDRSPNLDTILAGIRNDKGEPKYRNVEEGLRALHASQEYIPQLRQELSAKDRELEELRSKAAKAAELEEMVRELSKPKQPEATTPAALDEETLSRLVDRQLTDRQIREQAAANQRLVAEAVKNHFGEEKAEQEFYRQAGEFGMSPQDVNALAARSPSAVLKLFGVSVDGAKKQPYKSTPEGSVRAEAFASASTSLIGRETQPLGLGHTHTDVKNAVERARGMVKEMESAGLSVRDLTDPKNYFKFIKS